MSNKYVAHVRKQADGSWADPHDLIKHSEDTANRAAAFASKFQSQQWARAAGWGHDAGKARPKWLEYIKLKTGYGYDTEAHLEGKIGKIPHAIYGADLVERIYGKGIGRLLAYIIAGHHAGLPDWSSAEAGQASLQFRKSQVNDQDIEQIDSSLVAKLQELIPLRPPWRFKDGLDLSLWIRMIFSCLVDADYLDTELYMNKEKAENREQYLPIPALRERLQRHNEALAKKADPTPVNAIRNHILHKCIQAASGTQGVYSLTVPTGGGKTLSGLAFALEHACIHGLHRVIYVSSYMSIIEQNAEVFREAVGDDQVVEHHSNLGDEDIDVKMRLAMENWDAPLIVTTSVQLFESLFAAKPGRCRKLHNITNSVIVLDEVQLLPPAYLSPMLETLQLLVERYNVSIVLSTATQPAFKERRVDGQLFKGLKDVKEIIGTDEQVQSLFRSLNRTNIQFPDDPHAVESWERISEQLKQFEQVLCIVSDRKSCRELHGHMPAGTYHLSSLMCGQHRSDKIREIKEKLEDNYSNKTYLPVRVVSTQLVEAGVDLDFPVVYRAFAGLDSIMQAAGRCNRNGRLSPEPGHVVVFHPPRLPPVGILRKAADTTKSILSTTVTEAVTNPKIFERYFEQLFWRVHSLDEKGIVRLLDPKLHDPKECSIYFRRAAEQFQFIDNANQVTILVPYRDGQALLDQLRLNGPDRQIMRRLQRYMVTVYKQEFESLKRQGVIEDIGSDVFVLTSEDYYSEDLGLLIEPYDSM
ncbi:CRISPR-associated endonuclease Cas3'' [Paenibacillus xylaniclasticus]|uniref:CRISPR-associated endonuclease Cas3'' n=1 Tax=Paenibacillus xylaniclasticus TaxID=588083 RepID=UPI001773E18D|nr:MULTISPECIES: CRISPR-associated endonuclease Cas3'' [Paenibacillus]GFN33930.1 CRISPR-associated helicase Cas3 [Paenibacillus curdlanolyticus]